MAPSAFKTTRPSVLREAYSKGPSDALYDGANGNHCFDFGVVQFSVGRVESLGTPHPETHAPFTFRVKHDPIECIYPHCEIETYLDGILIPDIKPKSVKTWLRNKFREIGTIVKPPRP